MNLGLKWGVALFLAMATLAAPTAALADHDRRGHHGHRDHDRRGHDRREPRDHRQARGHDRHDRRDHDWRAPVRVVHHRPVVVHHHGGHRPGPPPWARGGYVHHYQRPVYVVNDYRGHGLRHPPRGHRWMRDDHGDFLLVAIATGVIVDLLLR